MKLRFLKAEKLKKSDYPFCTSAFQQKTEPHKSLTISHSWDPLFYINVFAAIVLVQYSRNMLWKVITARSFRSDPLYFFRNFLECSIFKAQVGVGNYSWTTFIPTLHQTWRFGLVLSLRLLLTPCGVLQPASCDWWSQSLATGLSSSTMGHR